MITDLKPYPTMKDSGVQSLGEMHVAELRARAKQGSEDLHKLAQGRTLPIRRNRPMGCRV